jgi:cytochrome c556
VQNLLRWSLAGLILLGAVGATKRVPAAIATGPAASKSKSTQEGLIFERQQIMKELDQESETLGNVVAGLEPRSKLAATTRAIAQAAKDALESFKNPLPGGRSKPEVWSNSADFMQRMATFVRETDELAKLGETGNIPAVTEKLVTALPCKSCHDVYRERKKALN